MLWKTFNVKIKKNIYYKYVGKSDKDKNICSQFFQYDFHKLNSNGSLSDPKPILPIGALNELKKYCKALIINDKSQSKVLTAL